jgi:arginase
VWSAGLSHTDCLEGGSVIQISWEAIMSDFGGALKRTDEYEFAILGVPYDEKSSYLKGAAKGPEVIRRASTGDSINAWTELGINLGEDTTLVDLGDVDVSGGYQAVSGRIKDRVQEIASQKAIPLILGGDHSISYPVVQALHRFYCPMDILHFDAHPDLYEDYEGDRFSHACPFARILEDGLVNRMVQVGIRAVTGAHRVLAEKYGVTMIEMKDMGKIPSFRFENPLYISVDIDALDPAYAPGVSHIEPGGMSTRQLIGIIQALNASIIGMDLVEVNGDRDPSGITAAAGVKILMEVMGKVVLDR